MKNTNTRRSTDRQAQHIHRGQGIFIPLWRMRKIKFEEAVVRSRAKREGISDPIIQHFTCCCGSLDCIAEPYDATPRRKKQK